MVILNILSKYNQSTFSSQTTLTDRKLQLVNQSYYYSHLEVLPIKSNRLKIAMMMTGSQLQQLSNFNQSYYYSHLEVLPIKSNRLKIAMMMTGSQVPKEQDLISDSIPGKSASVTKYAIAMEYMWQIIGREA